MKTTLYYGKMPVANFETLVRAFTKNSFTIRTRSTLPLLDYWRDSAGRLDEFCITIGLSPRREAQLHFEYPVAVRAGKGKASFTDLMIVDHEVVIAVEAKFTEPQYDSVSKWLGTQPSKNRERVLDGWLSLLNEVAGCRLTQQDIRDVTYQLVHRTASACSIPAARRIVVYHAFGNGADDYARSAAQFAQLLGSHCTLLAVGCKTKLLDEDGGRSCGEDLRERLIAGPLFIFGPLVRFRQVGGATCG